MIELKQMSRTERTYSERVTAQYQRISSLLGPQKAHFFNEYLRGASLLDASDDLFLSQIEATTDQTLIAVIKQYLEAVQDLLSHFGTTSIYQTFEKVKNTGRTKIFIWKNGIYQELVINQADQEKLPWAGTIHVGGPNQSISGTFSITRSYQYTFGVDFVIVNDHTFR